MSGERPAPSAEPARAATVPQAPAEDPARVDADELAAHPGHDRLLPLECLRPPADLHAPRPPRPGRCQVVDDEGDLAVVQDVAPFRRVAEPVAADVNGAVVVQAEPHRRVLQGPVGPSGRQPAEELRSQVYRLRVIEHRPASSDSRRQDRAQLERYRGLRGRAARPHVRSTAGYGMPARPAQRPLPGSRTGYELAWGRPGARGRVPADRSPATR